MGALAVRMLCMVAVALVLSVAPLARAAASTRPLDRLHQAQGALEALAGQARSPAVRRSLTAASAAVGRATAPTLWLDPGHLVAPLYGLSVFADSRTALAGLEHV